MSVIKIINNNLEEIINSDKKVLIDFYADWCVPCRELSPVIDEIAAEQNEFLVAKINVDENPDLASKFAIFSIPTLVVIHKGNVLKKARGSMPKDEVLELLED